MMYLKTPFSGKSTRRVEGYLCSRMVLVELDIRRRLIWAHILSLDIV